MARACLRSRNRQQRLALREDVEVELLFTVTKIVTPSAMVVVMFVPSAIVAIVVVTPTANAKRGIRGLSTSVKITLYARSAMDPIHSNLIATKGAQAAQHVVAISAAQVLEHPYAVVDVTGRATPYMQQERARQ